MLINQLNFYKLILTFILCLLIDQVSAQNGLGFASHEVVQDKRTSLSLFPNDPLCMQGDFEISFDICFYPHQENYFGYIARIIDDDGLSVDLVYDRKFKIVIGEKLSSLEVSIPNERLFSKWTRINIGFDVSKGLLKLECNGDRMEELVPLLDNRCHRIYFGAIDYKHYSSTDVPAMKIKDVRISRENKPIYYWPLDEKDGALPLDQLNHAQAWASNPLWINKLHFDWQPLWHLTTSGNASFAFDSKSETIFLVGSDSLISYNILSKRKEVLSYNSGKLHLPDGNQSIYDTITNSLINFDVDQQKALRFDWHTNRWSDTYLYPADKTNHGHANKFLSGVDSALYVLGGYGNFSYKNDVHRFLVKESRWELIDSQAHNLTPHYLAALGVVKSGAYILGGYGSLSGKQVLNPKNFYDLVYFDVAKKTFTKKMALSVLGEDFVFANSLVVDEQNGYFYALIFPKHRFQSRLQLIKGDLNKAEYSLLGNYIPYQFSDAHSFADLYYSYASKRFIAVTSYLNRQGITSVQIYGLAHPPLPLIRNSIEKKGYSYFTLIGVGVGLFSMLGIATVLLFKKKKNGLNRQDLNEASNLLTIEPLRQSAIEEEHLFLKIYLFGDLAVINTTGEDITKHFTPLLKELFLLILLYTLRSKKGISSEKLIELLWYDKSEESARNNRSANVAKLKQLIDKYSEIKLLKEGNYWRLDWPGDTYIDYSIYLDLIQVNREDKETILSCSEITKRGPFLMGIEYDWLDAFKSEISTKIISTYLQHIQSLALGGNADLVIALANEVFLFDPVNEEAVMLKCKALATIGQHSQAAHTFETFCKEYETLYGQKFDRDFKSIMLS